MAPPMPIGTMVKDRQFAFASTSTASTASEGDELSGPPEFFLPPSVEKLDKFTAPRTRSYRDRGDNQVRWWTKQDAPLLCPLTRFPIAMLPYPPFKLRLDPTRSVPHRLVDGKYLAMWVISTGRFEACGRALTVSDVQALDDYVCRCKLGPYRPGRAFSLAAQASAPGGEMASVELQRMVLGARAELVKVRRIQENRLAQLCQKGLLQHMPAAALRGDSPGASTGTGASSAEDALDVGVAPIEL